MLRAGELLRSVLAIAAFAVTYLIISALITNSYYQLMMTLVLVWALLGTSWNVLSGYSGLVSFGHASFFGLGAYTATLLLIHFDVTFWIGIPAAMVVGALAGAVIGWPTFRLHGVYFALAMLAYPLAFLYVFEWLGYQEVSIPLKRQDAIWHMQFTDQRAYGAIALVLLSAAMLVSAVIERSRFGMSLLAIKQNELAAEAAGIDTWRWKMRAIMVSGAIGGAAGALYAQILLVVTPAAVFGMLTSAQALIVTLFGGPATLWGPLIGASILIPVAEILHGELGHIIPGIQGVTFGSAVILVIALAPEGLYWKLRDRLLAGGRRPPPPAAALGSPAAATAEVAAAPPVRPIAFGPAILEVEGLSRHFGGLQALSDASLTARQGMILGIIGPNGAGKTTLFNVLNGFMPPTQGRMRFKGRDLLGLRPNQVCRLGVGRTFQVVRAFARMSVLDNVVVGAFVGAGTDAEAVALARAALGRVGMADQAELIAGGLTTKQLRLMELARALAPKPELILMDEPLAGLGHDEVEDLLAVVQRLRTDGTTIVIIEHTMHAMVRLADRIVVLDHGRVIAEGTPAEVTRLPNVIEAYLGKKWMNRAAD
ncbi:MAG: branched-chain amino acid ABC transporter ATP-binding protein/permease [Alphaproteobacteria bacterium]|nr:branched-chain amino acid ABC transporter ATP-binding protein/permease [Alphaproteobacteria bacterium]